MIYIYILYMIYRDGSRMSFFQACSLDAGSPPLPSSGNRTGPVPWNFSAFSQGNVSLIQGEPATYHD